LRRLCKIAQRATGQILESLLPHLVQSAQASMLSDAIVDHRGGAVKPAMRGPGIGGQELYALRWLPEGALLTTDGGFSRLKRAPLNGCAWSSAPPMQSVCTVKLRPWIRWKDMEIRTKEALQW
jgi:hypothetical protein